MSKGWFDYCDFEKVDRLPEDLPLIAVACVWGDYQNIRCLFVDAEGNGYMRNRRAQVKASQPGKALQRLG